MVRQFHRKYDHDVNAPVTKSLLAFRGKLVEEEANELTIAILEYNMGIGSMEAVLKELGDLQYVLTGFAVTFGIDMDVLMQKIHHSNMTKDGSKNGDGKVTKGDSYEPPNLYRMARELEVNQ